MLCHCILALKAGEENLAAASHMDTQAELGECGRIRPLVPMKKIEYFIFLEEKALTALLPTQ